MSGAETASWVFGAAALLWLSGVATYLMVRRRTEVLPPAASFIVGFLCAIAGGFCTYFFSGMLGLNFQIPGTNIKGDAAGGIGVFVLVLLVWLRFEGRGPRRVIINVTPAQTLESFDRILTNLEQVWMGLKTIETGNPPMPSVKHMREGHGDSEKIQFTQISDNQPLQTLTVEEVRNKLSKEEMQLLTDTENAMQKKVDAWRREYAAIQDPAKANVAAKRRLFRIASGMSGDLDSIFGAIKRTLNGQLQDHYAQEQWIASRADELLRDLESSGPVRGG